MSTFLTPPSVEASFEKQGPKLEELAIMGLATTLRRETPPVESLWDARLKLETPQDDYWPLDGTFPEVESMRWDHGKEDKLSSQFVNRKRRLEDQPSSPKKATGFMLASAVTMQDHTSRSISKTTLPTKFLSAADRMQELEAAQAEARLRAIDRRSEDTTAVSKAPAKKIKKAATGSANIMAFFNKNVDSASRPNPAPNVPSLARTKTTLEGRARVPPPVHRQISEPLHDISNVSLSRHDELKPDTQSTQYKVRTAPMQPTGALRKATAYEPLNKDKSYAFLSSSPPRSPSPPPPPRQAEQRNNAEVPSTTGFKAASTFHMTSMAEIAARPNPGRRTLGMGRNFKPWSARGGKGS